MTQAHFNPTRPIGPIRDKYVLFSSYRGPDAMHRAGGYELHFRGGFGTAKTTALCEREGRYRLQYPGSPGLIARSSLTVFNRTTLVTFLKLFSKFGTYKKLDSRFDWINGSITYFFGLDAPNAEDALKSFEVLNVEVDEADEITEDMYAVAKGRTRWQPEGELRTEYLEKKLGYVHTGDDGVERMVLPYSIGSAANFNGRDWIYYRFKHDRHQDDHVRARGYLEATTGENHSLPAGYVDGLLRERGEDFVKRFVYGDDNLQLGRIIHRFNSARSEDGTPAPASNLFTPGSIPSNWPLYILLDVGYEHPTAALIVRVSEDGRFWITHEYLEQHRLSRENALAIKALCAGITPEAVYGSPDAARTDPTSGKSAASEYAAVGLNIIPATHGHDASANTLNELFDTRQLEPGAISKPKLMISTGCARAIKQLEGYTWELRKRKARGSSQTTDPDGGDWDLYDAIRNIVAIPRDARADPRNLTPGRGIVKPKPPGRYS